MRVAGDSFSECRGESPQDDGLTDWSAEAQVAGRADGFEGGSNIVPSLVEGTAGLSAPAGIHAVHACQIRVAPIQNPQEGFEHSPITSKSPQGKP
jgi:hypothetical protein